MNALQHTHIRSALGGRLLNTVMLLILLLGFVLPPNAFAAQPLSSPTASIADLPQFVSPSPDLLDKIKSGKVKLPRYMTDKAWAASQGIEGNTMALPGTSLAQSAPLTGTIKMLAVAVDFSDKVHTVTASVFDSLLFALPVAGPGSMRDYYSEISYGQIDFVTVNLPSTLGWQRAPQTYAYYVNHNYGEGAYPNNAQKLAEDVIDAINGVVDFSQYDNDHDGNTEPIVIIHSGQGAEVTGSLDDLWSFSWSISSANARRYDGVTIRKFTVQPEYASVVTPTTSDQTMGVYAHEVAHGFFGVPDTYDTDYTSNGAGNFDLMAGGSWGGPSTSRGSVPSWPSAWIRKQMGIVSPVNIAANVTGRSIAQVYANSVDPVLKLTSSAMGPQEYFLVENRQKVTGTYDQYLPGGGLLIWHIDEAMTSNTAECALVPQSSCSDTAHYRVALQQADGLFELEKYIDRGDTGDPFPGSTNNRNWSSATLPESSSYYTVGDSCIAVNNISASGATMTADLKVNCPPVAVNDSYSTNEDTLLSVTAPGVLGNDTDAGGGTLAAVKVSDPANGTLVFNTNGSFTYTPTANWSGTDSFTYKANDGALDSGIATVTITVNPVNDAPVAAGDSYSANENSGLTIAAPGVLTNDTDIDSDPLTALKVSDPAHGTLAFNANGSFTYTPTPNYSGADSFTYKANDGLLDSNAATVDITVIPNEYTLTVVSPHGAVTKSPAKPTYHYGEEVTLSVVADEDWTFTGWTPALTANKVTITGDTTVTANFAQNEYTLTVNSAHGTVTRDNNGPYHLNDVVALTVVADEGWVFTGWTPALVDNKVIITGDTTVTANFAQNEYALTVNSAHGTVTRDNNGPYHLNDVVTLSVVADAGWTFTGWTPALTANKVTITGDTTVTANFTQNEYTLTVNSAHGTVTRDNNGPYHLNDVVTLAVVADEGWTFTDWTPALVANQVTITGDTTVTANFAQNTYNLEVSVVGSGAVSKSPDQTNYTAGSNVQLTATAAPGWTFSGWGGDASGSANPLNVMMDSNKAITATFTQNVYTLDVSVVGSGLVTRSNNGPYHLNDEVVLTATPGLGWSFAQWGGDAAGSANQFTLVMDGNKSVTATFLQSEYDLTVLTDGNGTVTRDNTGPYHLNDLVTLTAIPATGWTFSGWSGDCSGSGACAVTMDAHKTVTATFLPSEYVLTINTTGNGAVTRNPDRATYHYGDMVELTAVAGSGWTFDSWGDALSGNTNPQYITVNGDITASATFKQNSYTLGVSVVGSGAVSKSPDQPNYLSGSAVQLTATPASGWQFAGWSGDLSGDTNPLNVTMDSNKSVIATFTIIPPTCYPLAISHTGQGSDPVASPANSAECPAGQYVAGASINLSGAAPATGWQISGWTGTDNNASTAETNLVTMPASALAASVSYTQIEYSLAITVAGSGSVAKSPNQATYHYGDSVQLTATPASGWTFTGWSGNLSGTANPTSLTIDGNKSVTATFSQIPTSLAYGVHDEGTNNTQFFTVNPQTLAVNALGSLQKGADIEAVSQHPASGALYATAGTNNTHNQRGYLFSVNNQTGALTAIGYTGYKSVPGISFRNNGTLWGWAADKGLIQINLTTGKGTVKLSSSLHVGDIAWNNSGTTLYVVTTDKRLYSYNPANNKMTLMADNLPSGIESLDMRADGLLMMGIHGSTTIRAYDPLKKQFVSSQYVKTIYNDMEGIAWP